jgi:hypothetical protein
MSKPKLGKQARKLFTPNAPPQVGDKVIPQESELVFEIIRIDRPPETVIDSA